VASTRGTHECRIHIPDKELLYQQALSLTERTAALDIDRSFLETPTSEKKDPWVKMSNSISEGEIQIYLKSFFGTKR